eukprot:355521-Chlamydomonas_euryale.AAC.7
MQIMKAVLGASMCRVAWRRQPLWAEWPGAGSLHGRGTWRKQPEWTAIASRISNAIQSGCSRIATSCGKTGRTP